jgi:glucosamine-phosphate N-acetyltransferase
MPKSPAGYKIRPLRLGDLKKGLIETLQNLAETGNLTDRAAARTFREMRRDPSRVVFVAVLADGQVVGATTLLLERKFIHEGGLVAHIEDVAVRRGHEGKGVGSALVDAAIARARREGCYKCILDCKEELVPFYSRLGFRRHEVEMRLDLT